MARPITFTLDLEDLRPNAAAEIRYPAVCRRVLDFLAERNVHGTFFVVGTVAEAQPDLIREIAAAGHEIGLHGWRHVPLTELEPGEFRRETAKALAFVEDLAGAPVAGFRAPIFSLVPETAWATDVLAELGFVYSSSLLAAHNPLFGWPGAPTEPFCWPSGLAEFPVPLVTLGRFHVPYLGGTYLRLIPMPLIELARWWSTGWHRERNRTIGRRGREGKVPWSYIHTYDLDTAEPYWRVPEAGRLSPLLWVNRRGALRKLDRLLGNGAAPPLRERVDEAHRGGVYHRPLAGVAT